MDIQASGQTEFYNNRTSPLALSGNKNTVYIKGSSMVMRLTGNGNTLNLADSQLQIHVSGNGNNIVANNCRLRAGVAGNGNQLKVEAGSAQQVQVLYNNGFGNTLPNSSLQNNSNRPASNINSIFNNNMDSGMRNMQMGLNNMQMNMNKQMGIHNTNMNNMNRNMAQMNSNCNGSNMMNNNQSYNTNPDRNARYVQGYNNNMFNFNSNGGGGSGVSVNPYYASDRNANRNGGMGGMGGRNVFNNNTTNNNANMNRNFNVRPMNQHGYFNSPGQILPLVPPQNKQAQNTGLSDEDINRLPKSLHQGQPSECSICWQSIQPGQEVTFLLCFHNYHSQCSTQWLKKSATCPICQTNVKEAMDKAMNGIN